MSPYRLIKNIILILGLIPFVSGCVETNQANIAKTTFPAETMTSGVTLTPSIEVQPTSIDETQRPTNILPPISVEEAKSKIEMFIADNGCDLPCIWGITPGKTTLEDLRNLFGRYPEYEVPYDFYISSHINNSKGGILDTGLWEDNFLLNTSLEYSGKNNILDLLVLYTEFQYRTGEGITETGKPVYGDPVFSRAYQYYLLPSILSKYGNPSKVLIYPFPDNERIDPQEFSLVLVYDQGFMIEYIFPKEISGENYKGCHSKSAFITVSSWDPKNQPSFEEIVSMSTVGISQYTWQLFKNLEDTTALRAEKFAELLGNPENNGCIYTPMEYWVK